MLLAPVVQSAVPVGDAVKFRTAHTLAGGVEAFGRGRGAPKRQPALVHVRSLVVCAFVAAPRIPRGPSHPTMEKIARVWSGGVIGSGAKFAPPPRYRPEHATLVTPPDVAMMSPQSPGAIALTKPKKPSPLQQAPPGPVVAVVLDVEVLVVDVEDGSQDGTHVSGAPSLATWNLRALLEFGTTPPLPPQ
jgi:hypothetical protein